MKNTKNNLYKLFYTKTNRVSVCKKKIFSNHKETKQEKQKQKNKSGLNKKNTHTK